MIRIPNRYHLLGPLGLLAASLLLVSPGFAQRVDPHWPPPPFRVQLQLLPATALHYPTTPRADSAVIPPSYWLEGGAIVGGLSAIAGGALAVGLCGYGGPCHNPGLAAVGGAVVVGLVGFGIGALIGGQFPKP
jgi:hypothetical protein